MLTPRQEKNTARELQENYQRLNMDIEEILNDTNLTLDEFERVLNMDYPDPSNVWKVRDYFEYKLNEKGIPMYPFSVMKDHSVNHWYSYDKPWLNR